MSNSNYDIAYLKKYVNGELSPTEMYALEREAQRDPMLADILMGMEMDQNKTVLTTINNQIAQRVQKDNTAKIKVFDWKRLAIAAAAVIVLGIGLLLYRRQDKNSSEARRTAEVSITQEKPKTKVTAADSIIPSDDIASKIGPQDHLPQLADNNRTRLHEQHPLEEVTVLSREPSLRVKSLEEMKEGLNNDRPVFGIKTCRQYNCYRLCTNGKEKRCFPNHYDSWNIKFKQYPCRQSSGYCDATTTRYPATTYNSGQRDRLTYFGSDNHSTQ
jgi:hypothetical protein